MLCHHYTHPHLRRGSFSYPGHRQSQGPPAPERKTTRETGWVDDWWVNGRLSARIPFRSSQSVHAFLWDAQDLGDQSLDKILKEKGNLNGTRDTSP